VRSKTDLEPA